jgi:hypothetical protein
VRRLQLPWRGLHLKHGAHNEGVYDSMCELVLLSPEVVEDDEQERIEHLLLNSKGK